MIDGWMEMILPHAEDVEHLFQYKTWQINSFQVKADTGNELINWFSSGPKKVVL